MREIGRRLQVGRIAGSDAGHRGSSGGAWRRRALASAALLATFGAAAASAQAPAAWTARAQEELPRPDQPALSPDGRRVAFTLWRADLATKPSAWRGTVMVAAVDGGASHDFAAGEAGSAPQWRPDGGGIAFLSERGGQPEIWWWPRRGGAVRQLSATLAGVRAFRWLPSGREIVYVGRPGRSAGPVAAPGNDDAIVVDADPGNARLWRLTVDPQAPPQAGTPLTPPSFHVAADMGLSFGYLLSGFDVSPDGSSVVFTRTPSAAVNDWQRADVAVVDLGSGEIRPLATSRRAAGAPLFSPDGRFVAYTASEDPPTASFAARVEVVPASGGTPRELAPTFDQRPRLLGWSRDGRELYFGEVRGTLIRLSALPIDGGAPHDLDAGDRVMTALALAPSGDRVVFVGERADEAPEIWTSTLEPFAPRRLTALAPPASPLGRTELLRWPAPDGLEVEGLLTYPVGYVPGTKVPLLLVVHGGPTYYFLQDYIAAPDVYPIASFAARGFAVLRVNPRGSSGRGRSFRFANRGDWGGGDFHDLMSGVDHVIALGVADPERLGVMGWSYGGYMTAWIVSQTRRFAAASVGAGIVNLTSFAGTADIHDFAPDYFGGQPWEKPDLYLARSPLFHLAGVTTPTLIEQGQEDHRVPTAQGWELYRALRHLGVETSLVLYPRQGHELAEPRLELDAAERNLAWFERHLLGARR